MIWKSIGANKGISNIEQRDLKLIDTSNLCPSYLARISTITKDVFREVISDFRFSDFSD